MYAFGRRMARLDVGLWPNAEYKIKVIIGGFYVTTITRRIL
jgi:hypothetical protein